MMGKIMLSGKRRGIKKEEKSVAVMEEGRKEGRDGWINGQLIDQLIKG